MRSIQIGLTQEHPCSYLSNQKERVAIAVDAELHSAADYEMLLANGFRRSGETIYVPHCVNCHACQAIRVDVKHFKLSKSQRRLINKATSLRWELKPQMDSGWFSLYAAYISQRHRHGSMYPPKQQEFEHFSRATWLETHYLHIYSGKQLLAIAVTDMLPDSLSAFYTFFTPESDLSLGTLAVLCQIQYCKKLQKSWLYLGYQIDSCPAMNYKVHFHPHQRLVNRRWQG